MGLRGLQMTYIEDSLALVGSQHGVPPIEENQVTQLTQKRRSPTKYLEINEIFCNGQSRRF